MDTKTKVIIQNYEPELKDLRNFKANVTKLLFDDLKDLVRPKGVQFNDRDIYECIEGLRNLQTGFDEYDPEDGEYVKHHPSYNELKEENEKLKAENTRVKHQNEQQLKERMDIFVGKKQYNPVLEEIKKLKAENEKLKERNDHLEYWKEHEVESPWEAIVMIKEKDDEIKELKANFQVVWEVLGESSYADELNKRLFPENFEED